MPVTAELYSDKSHVGVRRVNIKISPTIHDKASVLARSRGATFSVLIRVLLEAEFERAYATPQSPKHLKQPKHKTK